MDTTYKRPVSSVRLTKARFFKRTAFVTALLILGIALWQVERARTFTPPALYSAPVLNIILTGAVFANLSFDSLDELAEVSITPSSFRFTTATDASLASRLEFQGVPDAVPNAVYTLNTGTYPLTLTLLNGGRAYQTFTAYDGTVALDENGGKVSAFLSDDLGRQIFLSARFRRPDALQSEVSVGSALYLSRQVTTNGF